MFFSASLIVLLGWTDTIILGIYRDSASVGKYHVILKIATVISFTLQAVDSILAPKLSRAFHDKDMTLFKKLVKVATIINSLISIILFLGIVFFQDFILGIFGKEFLLVSLPLLILCIGQLINSIFGPIGSIFQMTGNQKIFQNILLISFGINLTLNLLLAPKFGIKGVAIATAFSLITSKILGVIFIKNRIWNKSVEG
jgi:O-antigen/teichoic acid export membrane protein